MKIIWKILAGTVDVIVNVSVGLLALSLITGNGSVNCSRGFLNNSPFTCSYNLIVPYK